MLCEVRRKANLLKKIFWVKLFFFYFVKKFKIFSLPTGELNRIKLKMAVFLYFQKQKERNDKKKQHGHNLLTPIIDFFLNIV
ncbi:MAG: hypothetical protein A2504_14965 [Bdellovibrionales bacterium RIFOXYD12_FULL_39_22]|nr:MAG: hypothetical protein A2385_10430 [Bdellovibrionales bacterium RIFOXYB1_FULL_39_21]OFZ40876.1 MAG: hypothetical protein A2485_17590 [Bdellovibrionales bacterium RIFOXYC12_FULL_39_17]OFZ44417.1 MAG: hypothetical protein A2404_11200 [Bdellovibrionales bacterium RIFOXYC1_FULL_39_130]OFZ71882.1 MAG: hypothetical protein A2451_14095 [Bdellovibrionales bacterium RIFOXYC2_FULL_39_8]OFZ74164.1 MAG: hypothetical protein A2560_03865 [Bdellovibrionales bacterium RIFOXYD1_FULL_39_84]OFZ92013.1 MAG: